MVLTSYVVDTLDDSVATDGMLSLREAIIAANSNAAFSDAPAGQAGPGTVDTIRFAESLSGHVMNLGSGALPISDALKISDSNAFPLVIDGGGIDRIFELQSSELEVSNLTLRNGNAGQGGAIHVASGSELLLQEVTVHSSSADDGGAIYNTGGTVVIVGSTFSGNRADASSGSGGAIFSDSGSVTLDNSVLAFNSATRAGGAVEIVNGTFVATGSSFVRNESAGGAAALGNGGALHVSGVAKSLVLNSLVVGNVAASGGGGLWNQVGSTLEIVDSVIRGNEAFGDEASEGGGGIFNNGGTVHVMGEATLISNNFASGVAGSGGGIFNGGAAGIVNIIDATIDGNVANRAGGGIEAQAGTTTNLTDVILTNNNAGVGPDAVASPGNGGGLHITGAGNASIIGGEVSSNTAALEGGGLWNGLGTMTVNGTLVTNNTASGNGADDGGGGIFNLGGPLAIIEATITDNFADGLAGSGGGLLTLAGEVVISGSVFSFNSANRAGGGIEIVDGTLTMTDSNLISNDVDGGAGLPSPGNGGGLHVTGTETTVTIDGGSVFGNLAASEGGGLWNQVGSTLAIQNGTLIDSNEAFGDEASEGGGGIFNNGGTVHVMGEATLISNNFASGVAGSGGGIFNGGAAGIVNIIDATIDGNVANRAGGGIEAQAGTTTNLTDVILTNNNAGVGPDAVASPGNGGGLHITGAGNVSIIGGEVSSNMAALEGGGLWNGLGTMTVNGTLVTNNTASGNGADDGGGGIFNLGGPLAIIEATITDNFADGLAGSGGGLLTLAGEVVISGSVFSFNSANRAGGGIEIVDGTLTMTDSNLISNDVAGGAGLPSPGNGGGLHVTGTETTVTIDGGSVFGNLAASEGGGLWNQVGSTLTVQNGTLIDSNEAFGDEASEGGGGIFNNGGTVHVMGEATLISNNFASGVAGSGGGIFNGGAAGIVNIIDATIDRNVANRAGGGIEAQAGTTTNLTDVILTNNNAGVGPDAVASPGNGGGLHITGGGNASIIGGEVSSNTAALEGGGLWNGLGTMTVNGTLVTNNTASGNGADDGGGGIFNLGGPLAIIEATITDNFADGLAGSGGGLLTLAGEVVISGSVFSFNSANRAGGGIEIVDGTLTMTDSNLISNDVDGGAGLPSPGNGGGLHVTGTETTVTIDGGSVFGNLAASEGGGLWNQVGSTLAIQNGTLIDSNEAFGDEASEGGGGIFNNGGTVHVMGEATLISNNFASGVAGSGGGIFNGGAAGIVNIIDATIDGNVANRAGGGIEAQAGTTTNLTDVILTNNNAGVGPDAVASPGNGGGLHITGGGNASIIGGEVSSNTAALEGGGLWNGLGTMTVNGTLLASNVASGDALDDGGGAIFNSGGSLRLIDATLIGNTASGSNGSGGALLNLGGSVQASGLFVAFNRANRAGGGVEDNAGSLILSDSMLTGNFASSASGNGGGLHVTGPSVITISDSLINQNNAAAKGGGIANSPTGELTLQRTTVELNFASQGAGVFNEGLGGVLNILASTIARNVASSDGGGLLLEGGILNLTNATISSNSASMGGGIRTLAGDVSLTSVTIASNFATLGGGLSNLAASMVATNSLLTNNIGGAAPDIQGVLTSGGNNAIGNTSSTVITGDLTGVITDVPFPLGPLADNGGPTQVHLLSAGNPAIDGGRDSVPAFDQRGIERPQGLAFDIGAVELESSEAFASLIVQSDVNSDGFLTPLDALLVIRELNSSTAQGEASESGGAWTGLTALDVNRDGYLTPLDAFLIIDLINANHGGETVDEGEQDEHAQRLAVMMEQLVEQLDELKRQHELDFLVEDDLITSLARHRVRGV